MRASPSLNWSPPPLVLYPEQAERADGWRERVEAAVTAWPMSILPRLAYPRVARLVRVVNQLEPTLRKLDEAALCAKSDELRIALRNVGRHDQVVAEAFALVREAARRELGLRHYDVQLRGGFALLQGKVAEMNTGEGKTLAATLAACTAALAGTPVHIITVNDYLAQRDADEMGPLYRALGLRVGLVAHGQPPAERRASYACDVTYVSNKEIAFDYLRDRLALGRHPQNLRQKLKHLQGDRQIAERVVMRGLHFAIVDEADSILIDEARTPLIISRETESKDEQRWAEDALRLSDELEMDRDYRVLKDERRIELTPPGCERLAALGEDWGGIWRSVVRREEAARQALTARHLFHRGDHYLVRDDKVQIIDEYTGRIMADRAWSEGLHQLVEAKEGCPVTGRKIPVARMTYQRFFRRYRHLAGMTGTAQEVAWEFWSVYRLPVVRVPTNRPSRRQLLRARLCQSADDKWRIIVRRTAELTRQGRPVLIGTRSVTASEAISRWLSRAGLKHVVLSAAQDKDEADIIAQAGKRGRITVATNMAGRGVDISLARGVAALGGLHVILSERHDARRIDRQLEGRCGRQGDPGSVEAILSLDDALMELVNGKLLQRLAEYRDTMGAWEGLLLLRWAQRRAERSNSRARRDLMRLDRKQGLLLAFSGGME
jgi:preprotein translocase subunit SecA